MCTVPCDKVRTAAVLAGEEDTNNNHEDQHGDTEVERAPQEDLDVHFIVLFNYDNNLSHFFLFLMPIFIARLVYFD